MKTCKRWAGVIVGLLLAATSAHAAPPPTEVFYKDADINDAVLSPSGRRLAVTTAKGMPRVGLVVYDLAPGGRILRVAQFDDADVTDVHWVNDERLVYSQTDRTEGSGRSIEARGLFTVKADGTKFKQLVRRRWKPASSEGHLREETALDWNHRLLAVPPSSPGKVNEEVLLVEFSYGEQSYESPKWLNAATGNWRNFDDRQVPHAISWTADSLGEPRVAYSLDKGRLTAYWLAPGSKTWTPLFESGLLDTPFAVEAVDSNGSLFVTRPEGPQGYNALSRYDFERRAPAAKPLVATPGFDFRGDLVTDEAGKTLGVRLVVDGETTFWFDTAMKAFQERADNLFPGHVNRIDCRRCGAPDMVALVYSYSDQDPGRFYLFQAKPPEGEKSWRLIKAVREDIKPEQMATLELQRIKARDGRDLPVWVTRPPDAKGPLPAVVLVHGGPWVRGVQWRWHAQAQFLASRGYVVIEPEMRGSTGYGDAHFRAGFKQWGQAMQDDVADALRWAQKQGIASDKACIAGASYGGYSTLMGLAKDPDLYRCGIAWVAVTDLDLFVSGAWHVLDDIDAGSRAFTLPELVGDPAKDAAMIAANSPVRLAARIKAPVLLAFGDEDVRVPLAHGKRMRDALQAAGNTPVWVTYANEGHGFAKPENRLDFARRMEAFLAKHLNPGRP
ncbi:prolyl oligopeptidase family serine peptidase [Roseateles sp. P5_E7]